MFAPTMRPAVRGGGCAAGNFHGGHEVSRSAPETRGAHRAHSGPFVVRRHPVCALHEGRHMAGTGRPLLRVAVLWLAVATSVAAQSLQPAGWDAGIRLPEAVDTNPDPRILEISIAATVATVDIAPDRSVEAWTYNGGVPGPTIRLRVGDRLIVHFTNQLPTPTTIHWHGVRVPIEMDGVPGVSQPEVKPGDSFRYDFTVPDAGVYWYHPHVMAAEQVGFGLYGALIVEDPGETVGVVDELGWS